jgi:hypothetical protein
MVTFAGTISIDGAPPHRGVLVSVALFGVDTSDAEVPYGGEPPAEACTDVIEVCFERPGGADNLATTREWEFEASRPPGNYYLQLRVVLFRHHGGKMLAQAEQFFFSRRTVHLPEEGLAGITLPVVWPAIAVDDLHHFGTVRPQKRRPWWKFW